MPENVAAATTTTNNAEPDQGVTAMEPEETSSGESGPPSTLEFPIAGKLVRYHQAARKSDVDAAVLGKGGFGCVYRYTIDDSFTPPSSFDLSQSISSASSGHLTQFGPTTSENVQQDRFPLGTPNKLHSTSAHKGRPRIPSVVAVKLCRTPCSGSFDELQKTSLVDKKKRRAEMLDETQSHVRVVRGEGRIFAYLQAARQRSSRLQDPPLVKLLANLPPCGLSSQEEELLDELQEEDDDGPPTRLLVFEKLLELDSEQTSDGWIKSKKPWSHTRVEKIAREVIQGLQFLHEHNVTHGDLKPSNLMIDPRNGVVKIIDLGASRRFVQLSNKERNNRSAVEEQDQRVLSQGKCVAKLDPNLCAGLGSLTGSPYYMAPEILLQATRYTDINGRSRSVLEDYEEDYRAVLARHEWPLYQIGLSDLRRGWGIRADIWSWACTVQALLLRTIEEGQRPSSSIISPFDFSFSKHRDEMLEALYEKSPEEDNVPRFHQWCRALPLLIVKVAHEPAQLLAEAEPLTEALKICLKKALRHQDRRPTADFICRALESAPPRFSIEASVEGGTLRPLGNSLESPPRSKNQELSPGSHHSEVEHRLMTPSLSQGVSTAPSSEPGEFISTYLETEEGPEGSRNELESDVVQGFEMVSPKANSKARINKSLPDAATAAITATEPLSLPQAPSPCMSFASSAPRSVVQSPTPLSTPLSHRGAPPIRPPRDVLPNPEFRGAIDLVRFSSSTSLHSKAQGQMDTNVGLGLGMTEVGRGDSMKWPSWTNGDTAGGGYSSSPSSPTHWRGASLPLLSPKSPNSFSSQIKTRTISLSFSKNRDTTPSKSPLGAVDNGDLETRPQGKKPSPLRQLTQLTTTFRERQERAKTPIRWIPGTFLKHQCQTRDESEFPSYQQQIRNPDDHAPALASPVSITGFDASVMGSRPKGLGKGDTQSKRLLRRLFTWNTSASSSHLADH